jgi:cobalt/nickel transport system permease protein
LKRLQSAISNPESAILDMPGPIEHLPSTQSPLGRFDPRWKLAALVLAASAVIFLQGLSAASLALLGAAFLAVFARLPWRWCLARLGLVLLVLAPFLILMPFVHDDPEPFARVGRLAFSLGGLTAAAVLACKTVTLVLLMLVLLATAPLPATLQAAQALHVPNLLVQLALLTYRYVFVLAGELGRLRVALRVRGYRNRANLHCYRTVGHVAGTLLVRGYEQAERVQQAMRARGFAGRFQTLTDWHTTPADVAWFFVIVGSALAVLIADRVPL